MQSVHQQFDFGLLPDSSGPPMNRSQMNGLHQPPIQDAYMDDGSGPSSHEDESPLKEFRTLNVLGFKSKAKTTKDGLPAKKRGPKRDSKPAMSRKQELNRQAQRTHRERKEQYTKGLEIEVARLKEAYANLSNESTRHAQIYRTHEVSFQALRQENERLKQLLQVHNISYDQVVAAPTDVRTPTQTQHATHEQMSNASRQVSPQAYRTDQQQLINFNDLPPSYMSTPSDTQTLQPGGIDIVGSDIPHRTLSNGGSSTSPSSLASSQGGFSHFSQASTGGSSYAQRAITPVSTTRSSPSFGMPARHIQHEDSSTIDTVISNTSSNFRPPLGQGLVNGKVVRNASDERTQQKELDHDQMAVDFVLALEDSCKDHVEYLNKRAAPQEAHQANLELSGHAMMLSNPPPSHIANNSEVPWTQAPPDIPIRHLMVLMDTASKIQLPRKGEITPVLALKRIRNDERYGLLTRQQFDNLTRLLQSKSRCYGFGSVLEEFMVDDALSAVFNDPDYSLSSTEYTHHACSRRH